jgi:hypothetical protein
LEILKRISLLCGIKIFNQTTPYLQFAIEELHILLGTNFNLHEKFKQPMSFDLVPYVALPPEDQYRLLCATSEKARQWFIIEHLHKLIPALQAAEHVKNKVQLNGHFRNEKPPEF